MRRSVPAQVSALVAGTRRGERPEVGVDVPGTREWERACILRSKAGDERAFGELLRHYQHRVFALIARLVQRHDEAHELTQETFLIAFREQARFDVERAFCPWLFKIAVNTCRNHMRHHARREIPQATMQFEGSVWKSDEPSADTALSVIEDRKRVLAAMQRLSPDDRAILLLRFHEDLDYPDLSVALGRPAAILKVRLHRALKRLGRLLEAE